MSLVLHKLHSHDIFDLSQERRHALHVIRAAGRSAMACVPSPWISIWLPLSGDLEVQSAQCRWLLGSGDLLVWRDGPLQASSRKPGWWLAVCGSPSAWARHMRPLPDEPAAEIFPEESACPRDLRRTIVRLARALGRDNASARNAEPAADMLCSALAEHQAGLSLLLDRCNGRTRQRRQQTLMRLLRVQHLIRRHENCRFDLAYLAASANYSPCHLIRSYREVFGETPFEYATRLRAERAWRLVRDTRMPVCEITEAVGLESQSAFCRAFKNVYGMTTSQARNRLADEPPAARAA